MEVLAFLWLAVGLVLLVRIVQQRKAGAEAGKCTLPPIAAADAAPATAATAEPVAIHALTRIAEAMTADRATEAALAMVRELRGVERVVWFEHDRTRDQWIVGACALQAASADAGANAPVVPDELLRLALRRREVLDARSDVGARAELTRTRAMAAVPVLDRALTVGAIVVFGPTDGPDHRPILDCVRAVLGASLANARLARLALDRQQNDPLTGLPSVETVVASVANHLDRGHVSVALLAMPQMRDINLRHGRQAGDRALAAVARLVALEAGAEAEVGRFGGATLLVAFPGQTRDDAERLVARIVDRVGDTLRAGPGRGDEALCLEVAVADGKGGDAQALLRLAESRLTGLGDRITSTRPEET